MANKHHWDLQHQKKRLEYLFRAYLQPDGDGWHIRHGLLSDLARQCGDHYSWTESIFIGPYRDRQYWMMFGFKEYEHKLKFEAGMPAVMAIEIKTPDVASLRVGGVDPNRDLSDVARRMAHKPYRGQWR